ncbi:MAG: SCP2 sterol-binding domain-containing protein [Xanthomonadales bacterium]|nr:SCP2 sterol-binding domain-containing protein [Xanthomonadales bacterium]
MQAADARFPPPAMRAFAGRMLERMLNRGVALDPALRESLAALDGQRVQLFLRGPELRFNVRVDADRLRVEAPAEADLTIASTPGGLLGMAARRGGSSTASGKVAIAGDAELAQRLQHLMAAYTPDFEAALANQFGDVLGVPLARGLHAAVQGLRRHARNAAEDSADWLRDESRQTPPRHEVDDWLDGVDSVRERADRLAARLQRLEAKP